MARARSIKPGFFSNEELSELPFAARLLFAGLWTLADRAGRLEDRPKRIKGQIFPHDNVQIDSLLTKLHEAHFIVRYEVDGNRFISIPKFSSHQNPHHREPESLIPAPGQPQASLGISRPSRADSGLRTPDSLNPIPHSGLPEPDSPSPIPDSPASVPRSPSKPEVVLFEPPPDPIRQITEALAEATGNLADTGIAERLCHDAASDGCHPELTRRWIRDKGAARKTRGDPIRSAKIFLEDWPRELRAWVSANLAVLNGGRWGLAERVPCGRCRSDMLRFEDGCIVRCGCVPVESKLRRVR